MKRLLFFALLISFLSSAYVASPADFTVEPDTSTHQVIGGLYAVAAAAALHNAKNAKNAKSELRLENLGEYFNLNNDVTAQWLKNVKISRVNGTLWAGVPVERFSGARRFLRAHAAELRIMESAGGRPWIGGEAAWLELSGKTRLNAAEGTGSDAEILFLNASGTNFWWQIIPEFKTKTRDKILKNFAVNNDVKPELHAPAGNPENSAKITASPVKLPADIRVGGKNSNDINIDMGNVIFTPVPKLNRD